MVIALKPEQERIIGAHLASGRFRSAEEVVATALASLAAPPPADETAVARLLAFREAHRIKLGPGERVEDLKHEGHRY